MPQEALWRAVRETEAPALVAELRRELHPQHPLYGKAVTAIARRIDCDDVIFAVNNRFALVHLTWESTIRVPFPYTIFFEHIEEIWAYAREDQR